MNTQRLFWISGLAVAGAFAAGCEREPATNTAPSTAEIQEELDEARDAVAEFTEQQKNDFVAAAERQVDEIEHEIEQLEDAAKERGAEAEAKFAEMRDDLNDQLQEAKDALADARNATGDAWDSVTAGFNDAMADLRASFTRARNAITNPT